MRVAVKYEKKEDWGPGIPKEPKAKFSQISPLPFWSHFGINFRRKNRYKIREIFAAQNELKMESQGGA